VHWLTEFFEIFGLKIGPSTWIFFTFTSDSAASHKPRFTFTFKRARGAGLHQPGFTLTFGAGRGGRK
jgi:hypothetical protein